MNFIEPRIYTQYQFVICQDIIYTHGVRNIMQLPGITQCALNATTNSGGFLAVQTALQSIAGQKEKTTRARRSIATFQIRKKDKIGCAMNLRKKKLFFFLDYFVSVYLPSTYRTGVRVDVSFAERKKSSSTMRNTTQLGNCKRNFGVTHFTLFPELQPHFIILSNLGGCGCEFFVKQPRKKGFTPRVCFAGLTRESTMRKHSSRDLDNSPSMEILLLTALQLAS